MLARNVLLLESFLSLVLGHSLGFGSLGFGHLTCVSPKRDLGLVSETKLPVFAAILEASPRVLPGSKTPFTLERANSSKGEDAKLWASRCWAEMPQGTRRRVVAKLPNGWTEAKSPSVPRRRPQRQLCGACQDPGVADQALRGGLPSLFLIPPRLKPARIEVSIRAGFFFLECGGSTPLSFLGE